MKINGILLVDKPEGLTSHDVVACARKAFNTKQVGHAGTLDPFATGLLVLLLGEATKLSDYLRDGDKTYIAELQLGSETDTLDKTGIVTKKCDVNVSSEEVKSAIVKATGNLELSIPLFSAKKVNGEKLYQKARRGEKFQTPTKIMSFFAIHPLSIDGKQAKAQVSCKSGGFIRSWAQYIGETLGCGAHLKELRRIQSSDFTIDSAVTIEQLESLDPEALSSHKAFKPLNQCLLNLPTVTVKGREAQLLKNGQIAHLLEKRLVFEQKQSQNLLKPLGVRVVCGDSGHLLALLEARPKGRLKIRRNFRL